VEVRQVTIIGVGLIGGSLGLNFKSLKDAPRVIGFSQSKETLEKAKKMGAIDEYKENIKEAVLGSDIVFICTPVSKIVEIAKEAALAMKKNSVLTDVGSTKSAIVDKIESFLPDDIFFIGGHPMAGSENYGIENAQEDLFKNSRYILTPTQKTNTQAFQLLHHLLAKTGADVIAINADKHDRIVASLSHLPHIVAASLVNLVDKEESRKENWLAIAAGGFKDTTRIAASSAQLWLDICLENKTAIVKSLKEFRQVMDCMTDLIEREDREALRSKLEQARNARLSMVTVDEKEFEQLRDLFIPVEDKPGVISDITLTIGEIGLNIADIEIVHSDENAGNIRISLIGDTEAKKAAQVLRDKGYLVSIRGLYND
jgi:prephenate dehydrogenase